MTFSDLFDLPAETLCRWAQDPAGEICADSQALHGTVRTLEEWAQLNLLPGAPQLACGGDCDCRLLIVAPPESKEEEIIEESQPEETAEHIGGLGTLTNLPVLDAQQGEFVSRRRAARNTAPRPAAQQPDGSVLLGATKNKRIIIR